MSTEKLDMGFAIEAEGWSWHRQTDQSRLCLWIILTNALEKKERVPGSLHKCTIVLLYPDFRIDLERALTARGFSHRTCLR